MESRITEINGEEVVNFIPSNDIKGALVSLNVLKKLTALLPQGNMYTIKRSLRNSLENIESIAEYVAILKEEVEFHESVNLITEFTNNEQINVEAQVDQLSV